MVGAGALVLVARYAPGEVFAARGAAGTPGGVADVGLKGPLSPSVYLAIDTDGTVYAIAHRSEMGSGSRTALPRIIADELDADWARVKIVQATGDEKFGDQDTDGSHSVRGSFATLRETGASARLMLVRRRLNNGACRKRSARPVCMKCCTASRDGKSPTAS